MTTQSSGISVKPCFSFPNSNKAKTAGYMGIFHPADMYASPLHALSFVDLESNLKFHPEVTGHFDATRNAT